MKTTHTETRELVVAQPVRMVQPRLIDIAPDKLLERTGERRTRFGRVAERVIEELTDAVPIPKNGNADIVFDAFWHGHFCEIKNVRASSSIPIYRWRAEKERLAMHSGHQVVYVITAHRCEAVSCLAEVWSEMARTLRDVYVIGANLVHEMAAQKKVHQVVKPNPDSRMGYEREGYCEGYQLLPVSELRSLDYLSTQWRVAGEIYGHRFNARLHKHSGLRRKCVFSELGVAKKRSSS